MARFQCFCTNFVSTVPVDNPALHQGRTRSQPHVDGNWPSHIYIPVSLSDAVNPKLLKVLRRAVADARRLVPELHSYLDSAASSRSPGDKRADRQDGGIQLHISLSRAIFVRAHQREIIKKAVRQSITNFVRPWINKAAPEDNPFPSQSANLSSVREVCGYSPN